MPQPWVGPGSGRPADSKKRGSKKWVQKVKKEYKKKGQGGGQIARPATAFGDETGAQRADADAAHRPSGGLMMQYRGMPRVGSHVHRAGTYGARMSLA